MVRLFSHYFPLGTLLLVALDTVCLLLAVLIGLVLLGVDGTAENMRNLIPGTIVFVGIMIASSGALGLYGDTAREEFWAFAGKLIVPLAIGLAVINWMAFSSADGAIALRAIAVAVIFGSVARLATFSLTRASTSLITRRIMVIGVGADAALVKDTIEHSKLQGLHIVGFYSPTAAPEQVANLPANKILLPSASIMDTAKRLNVDEIIIAVRERRGGMLPLNELLNCKLGGIKVTDFSSFFENYKSRVKIDLLRESWFIFGDGFRQNWSRMFVKRAFDIFASLILLIVSMPIMVIAMIAIKLESHGPIIYRQQRVGLGGKCFDVLKFRSMSVDAEKDGTPRWAQKRDSRVTRVGRIMRLTRIDELPQLLTVLRGEMSLVGPRPERPFFVDQIAEKVPFYAARHSVKPGVTGWAQVKHHYGASLDDASDKLEYDLYYVKNHTLFLDILVLFYSVKVVLTAQGSR
jgi:sugar transferase (PEP-CTERM system associated)